MKQHGIIKLKGTYDDVTFFESKDGFLARKKGGVSKERIKSDPQFARVRENDQEFGSAASAGKLLRDTLNALMRNAKDFRVVSRMTQVMSKIQKLDAISARGGRNVGAGIADPTAQALLKGFEFNNRSQMSTVLQKPFSTDVFTGNITITGLEPINDIRIPDGATHVTLRGAYANVNFGSRVSNIEYSNEVNLPLDTARTNVVLAPVSVPAGTGTKLYLLQIEFFQLVNAVQYELNNGGFNALVITEVA